MYIIESSYYERTFELSEEEAQMLLDIYLSIAKEKKFTPDVEEIELLVNDVSIFDTVMYHVETFGSEHENFESIEHIF
jgi:hypothetical protein